MSLKNAEAFSLGYGSAIGGVQVTGSEDQAERPRLAGIQSTAQFVKPPLSLVRLKRLLPDGNCASNRRCWKNTRATNGLPGIFTRR